jgi:hypothetical protein
MGAVTSLMYVAKDPTIAGMVLDSPFSSLKLLVSELVSDKVSLPDFIVNQALKLVKSTVKKKAKFELDDIEPIRYAESCFIPCLFVHAKGDDFVKPHHSKKLHEVYPGDKNLVNIEGDHNSYRPKFFKDSAGIFFYNTLQVQYLKQISDDYAGFTHPKNDVQNEPNPIPNSNISDNVSNNLSMEDQVDEEEMFQKILELSKATYQEETKKNQSNGNPDNIDNNK